MKVVVFGGTGFAGAKIVRELRERGHEVEAVARSGDGVRSGSVYDADFVDSVAEGADAIVSAVPALAAGDQEVAEAYAILIAAARRHGTRIAGVGGASMWPAEPGEPPMSQAPGFPPEVRARAVAHTRALAVLEQSPPDVDWFYLIPSVAFGAHAPGERTASYRTSTHALVGGGASHISGEDFAVAFVDELESPRHHRQAFTVGY